MDERPLWDRPDEQKEADPKDGIRLLGSHEAAEAIERGDVAKRRGDGTPKYGDRPAPPPEDGPRPALRFPLVRGDEGPDVARPRVSAPPPLSNWGGPVRRHPRAAGGERPPRPSAIPQGDPASFPRPGGGPVPAAGGNAGDDPVTAPSPAVRAGDPPHGDGTPASVGTADEAETAPTPAVRRITSTPSPPGSSVSADPGVPAPVASVVPTPGDRPAVGEPGGAVRMRPGADDDVVRRHPEAGPGEVVDRSIRREAPAGAAAPVAGPTDDAAPTASAVPAVSGTADGDDGGRADAGRLGGAGDDGSSRTTPAAGDDTGVPAGAVATGGGPDSADVRSSGRADGSASPPSDAGAGAGVSASADAVAGVGAEGRSVTGTGDVDGPDPGPATVSSGPAHASPTTGTGAVTSEPGGDRVAPGEPAGSPMPTSTGGRTDDDAAAGRFQEEADVATPEPTTVAERTDGAPPVAPQTPADRSGDTATTAAATPEQPSWEVLGRSNARWRNWDEGDVEESVLDRPGGRVTPGSAAGDEAPLDPSEEQARPAPFGFLRETPAFAPGEPQPAPSLESGGEVSASDVSSSDAAVPEDPAPGSATLADTDTDTDTSADVQDDAEAAGPGGATSVRIPELRAVPTPPRSEAQTDVDDTGDGPAGPAAAVHPSPPQRDVRLAVVSGAALAGLAAVLFSLGDTAAMVLVGVVIVVATAELFSALQRGGYQPATLVGLVATAGLATGTYLQGEAALPVVMGLAVITGLLWYLLGVTRIEPTMNVGVTVLAVAYVGLLGSFAALILRYPNGRGVLAGVIVAVVANDIGALAAGRSFGKRLLAPSISPNKTAEGLVGGAVASILASVVLLGGVGPFGMHPWELGSAVLLGLVVAVVAPLGDLSESLLKRDLGIKDMSAVIPGHGGVLDRVDALLFCLPAVYYLTRLLEIA